MSSRVGGAVALAAAALLAVSMLTSWWSGHPTAGGHEQEAKTVFTTLLGATGCNTGGDGRCQELTELLPSVFKTTAFVEFMVVGVSALIAIALGVTSLFGAAIRKPIAKLVRIAIVIAFLGAIALRVQGPEFKGAAVTVYFALGSFMLAGAVVSLFLASWLAIRVPQPRVERPRPQPAPAPQPGFDVAQMFLEDQLRPAPQPAMRPSSPGGALPGPAGPLTPGGQPLFASSPQLRPLYEAEGYVPQPAPAIPARPPTPVPRANIGAILGMPPPIDADRARPPTAPPPPLAATVAAPIIAAPPPIVSAPPPVIAPPPIDAMRAKPATLPPPMRARTSSVPPPPPRPTAIGVAGGPSAIGVAGGPSAIGVAPGPSAIGVAGGPSAIGVAGGPSAIGVARGPSAIGVAGGPSAIGVAPGPSAIGVARGPSAIGAAGGPAPEPNFDEPVKSMPGVPPVVTPSIPAPKGSSVGPRVPPRKAPTISAAVVPPPPAIVPPVIPSLFPARPETDADPSAAVGDSTDASIHGFPGDDGTSPSVQATAEERAAAQDDMLAPRDKPGDVAGDGIDEAETKAREKMSARELGLATSDSTMPLVKDEPVAVPARGPAGNVHEAATVPQRVKPASADVPVPMPARWQPAAGDVHEAATVPARYRPTAGDADEAATVPARYRPTAGDADEAATVPARFRPAAGDVNETLVPAKWGATSAADEAGTVPARPTTADVEGVTVPAPRQPAPTPEPEPATVEESPAESQVPAEPAPPVIPDPPKVVPTLTSIARALRSHARAERERERTATNIKAVGERPGDEPTSPPIEPPVAPQRTSVPMPAQRTSAPMSAQRTSAPMPAQRTSAPMRSARPSAQVPAHIPPQRVSAPVAVQRPSAQVAAQPEERPRTSSQVPITTAPDDLPPPTEKQAATSGPSPACPQCESPMAWVEEHLRFYCKSCRMYF